jgi:hypothetical protein
MFRSKDRGKVDWLLMALGAYGLLNAVLYSLLMPLWEGFDEPFHYAYVERLSTRPGFPVLGRSPVSAEVWESIRLAPASHVVRQNLPFVMTFSEYFALPGADRAARRERLMTLSPALRRLDAPGTSNYEAQQAPLGYLPLVLPNNLCGNLPLPARVLRLRLVCGLVACLLQTLLTLALARMLKLSKAAQSAALLLVLSSQMFYASIARVSNDWLAIPLVTLLLIGVLRFYREPRIRTGVLLGGALAAGLLTKAYFLPWGLFAGGVLIWVGLRRSAARLPTLAMVLTVLLAAGPWYARNLCLYGSLSATLQSAAGIGPWETLQTALTMPWGSVLMSLARGALWTGNSSFTSFSASTLNLMLALLLVAALLWVRTAWRASGSALEWLIAAGCAVFVVALLYACAMFFAFTKSRVVTATPWYAQALAAPLACLLCLGLSRSGSIGRWIAAALVALSSYVLATTYVAKLIPLYGGYPEGRVRAAQLLAWYFDGTARHREILAATALGNPGVIWPLTALVALLAVIVCVLVCRKIFTGAVA